MTAIEESPTATSRGDELSAAEIEAIRRSTVLVEPDEATPDEFPRLWNMSAAFAYDGVIRATDPEPPEFVTIPLRNGGSLEACGAMSMWNMLWEAAQFRRRMFDEEELIKPIRKVADAGDVNVVFVPRTRSRYFEYAPLYHLLPRATLERHGLPLLTKGQWPFITDNGLRAEYLDADFATRLSNAWSAEVWPYLMQGAKTPTGRMGDFSSSDPIKLLAHNLDFWLPPVNDVVQGILRELPEVDKGRIEEIVRLVDGTMLDGATVANPRVGSDVWRGEQEALSALARTVEAADTRGHLRAILDAVHSHRVEDDFSPVWSRAREDFERKLNHSRAKVKVSFVEIPDTVPVHSPESEIVDRLAVSDFLSLLDDKQRKVVVLIRSGTTKLSEVARELGYANHSGISKQLDSIRKKAGRYFDGR